MSIINKFKRKNKTITLKQELWIAILTIIFVSFICSVLISTNSAKNFFSTQFRLKNVDNANSLALILSQMEKDPVDIELLISAAFDTGYYQRIELVDPEKNTLIKRVFKGEVATKAPHWFSHLYELDIKPGVAQVSNGWQQFGTLYVESHAKYTQDALWQNAVRLFFSFLVVALCGCVASGYILTKVLRPLSDVIAQAIALSEKRFIKSKVPLTYEFAKLVTSMNDLSSSFSRIIREDKRRLEEMLFKNQHDELTGLANREYFNAALDSVIEESTNQKNKALFLFRLINLDNIGEQRSRPEMLSFINKFVETLTLFVKEQDAHFKDSQIARMANADFMVFLHDVTDIKLLSDTILLQHEKLVADYTAQNVAISHGCTFFEEDDTRFTLLTRVDSLLKEALSKPGSNNRIKKTQLQNNAIDDDASWQIAIDTALKDKDFEISTHPVNRFTNELIMQQLSLSLIIDGITYQKYRYYSHVVKQDLKVKLDWNLVKLIVANYAESHPDSMLSLELSEATLSDDSAIASILTYLAAFPALAHLICFYINADFAMKERNMLNAFCQQVNRLGAKVALVDVGAEITKIHNIQELGLAFIKIGRVYCHNVSFNEANQHFLRGACSLAHSIGIKVIAEGIKSSEDRDTLQMVGFDGYTMQLDKK